MKLEGSLIMRIHYNGDAGKGGVTRGGRRGGTRGGRRGSTRDGMRCGRRGGTRGVRKGGMRDGRRGDRGAVEGVTRGQISLLFLIFNLDAEIQLKLSAHKEKKIRITKY